MRGLPRRSARLLAMLVAGRATVSADLLVREALEPASDLHNEILRTRQALVRLGAPGTIETAHNLGYRATPELRAWVSERVSA